MGKLTCQKKKFCQEYIKDWHATNSAIRAGYSEHSAYAIGSALLKKPEVKDEIARICDEALTTERQRLKYYVLDGLKAMVDTDLTDVVNIVDGNAVINDTAPLSKKAKSAIEEMSQSITREGGTVRIKMHSKVKALELLGRYAGMFNDKLELSGSVENINTDMNPAARAAAFEELMAGSKEEPENASVLADQKNE